MEQTSRELKTSSDQSELRDMDKDSWENNGRESSLYRWSSVTESIQFAESDSSMDITGNTTSRSNTDTTGDKQDSDSRLSTDNKSSSTGDDITTETNDDELYRGYSEDEFELSEESDEMDRKEELRDEFLYKKLQILATKRSLSLANAEVPILEDEVDMEYCKKKIQLLNKNQTDGQEECKKNDIEVPKDIKAEPCQLENARNVERMKINNLIFKMNKDAAPAHQPRKCKKCRKLQGQITEGSFIRKKTGILKKQQLELKIEKHLYEKDSATLIAEIINSGPKPSDPPQEIWDRLLRKEYN